MGLQPKRARRSGSIYSIPTPPDSFVSAAMHFTVMSSAQRHRELVADLAPKGATLRKAQVMGVARLTTAHEAALLGDKPDMIAVANPPRLGMRQDRFVDN